MFSPISSAGKLRHGETASYARPTGLFVPAAWLGEGARAPGPGLWFSLRAPSSCVFSESGPLSVLFPWLQRCPRKALSLTCFCVCLARPGRPVCTRLVGARAGTVTGPQGSGPVLAVT